MSKMKFIVCALALGISSASVHAVEGQGQVTFNGELIDDTCIIDNESRDIQVTLPTLSVKSLDVAGAEAGSTSFRIKAIQCPSAITKVGAHFEVLNSAYDSSTGNLLNLLEQTDPTNSATNAQVRLYNDDSTQVRVGSTGKKFNVDTTTQSVTMEYLGGYYASAATTAGLVKASVIYTLAYN